MWAGSTCTVVVCCLSGRMGRAVGKIRRGASVLPSIYRTVSNPYAFSLKGGPCLRKAVPFRARVSALHTCANTEDAFFTHP